MNPLVRSRVDMFGVYCILGYIALLFLGWGVIAGFLTPPVSPAKDAEDIADLFKEDTTRIRIGMVVAMMAALVFVPFVAIASKYMMRIEGGAGVLTYTMVLGGVGNMVLSFYPPIMWLAVAFRPDRDPDIMYMINDMAWLQFIGGVTMFLAMPLAVFAAGLLASDESVIPRWAAYASAWCAAGVVCDQVLFFFTDGPFAWNGVIGLWVPVVFFGGFFILMFVVLRAAVLRDRALLEQGVDPAEPRFV